MGSQAYFWRLPEVATVILRPAHILGTVKNAPSNYLRLAVVPTLLGFDPMMQAVHQDDVVRAIMLALKPAVRGKKNPGTAVGRGVRTVMVRLLGGEKRHYETRTGTFRP